MVTNAAQRLEAVLGEDGADISESHSDCESLASSQTSTDLYDHEPFETFAQKVHSILTSLFPNDLPIEMERIPGGFYNRVVVGVLKSDILHHQRRIVVRIPRFTYCSHVNEVAILRFLKQDTSIPVPRVLHYEASSTNIISDPFMILEHSPGQRLEDVYDSMSAETKKLVVSSVVRLLKQLSEITFDVIGTLLSDSGDGRGVKVGHASHIAVESQRAPPPVPALARSIRGYLEERWSFLVAEEQRQNPGDTFDLRFTTSQRAAAAKLQIPDLQTPARIVLYHTDLAPRNIFVDTESGAITGVLDWDKAESAPVEVAWQMPTWLWDTEASGSNQLNWVSPDVIPSDSQAAAIRQFFIDEIEKALPGFIETVRQNKQISELLTFARLGLHSEEVIYKARDFLSQLGVEVAPPPCG